ncbi:MAG: ABC transporter ATP-binding protein [Clostridia bacterium]|nr:ABC transporter ATP-binding protein [Clostridia bacterium]
MIKKLSKFIGQYKIPTILTPILISLEVVMEVIIPLVMAELIDKGVYAGEMNLIYKLGLQLVILAMLSLFFGATNGFTAAKASAGFAKNLRQALYYKVQDFSFSNIDKFSTASLVTRLTTDVSNVQQAFQMLIRITVRAPLMFAFSLIAALKINAKLALIFVCVIPVLGFAIYKIISKTHPIMKATFKKYDKLNNVVEENVSSMRVVKSFVLEDEEIEKFKGVSGVIYNNFIKAEKNMTFMPVIMDTAIYTCVVLVSWLGAKIIVDSNMTLLTTGELMTLITYSIQILTSLLMVSMVALMLTNAKASGDRIVEVLDEEIDIVNKENAITEVKDGSIEFDNVSFSYVKDMEKLCLKNINIKINPGEVVGIIGGTGSGKSTLVNLIPRLYDVTDGILKVGGIDVREYDIKALRDQVACVLQKNVLFSGSISENIRWGNESATDEEVERVCKLAQADDFIKAFPDGYNTHIEQGGTNVSGGQKQRLCIARALLKKPKILILDDSTSAVDTRTDALIRKAFREEIPDTTKIIIAQRINSVEDADKIIVIDGGVINGFGTHEELLKTNAIYKEVYDSQVKGSDEA